MPRQQSLVAQARPTAAQVLSLPPRWLALYENFITKNAGQVSQIESALRSLTYIIPGRFRDAEIASESIHSGVQLLSLYHDSLLSRAAARLPVSPPPRSAHARYTRFWTRRSALYRRVAVVLQMVTYTELLCEMAAKRRGGERARWKVVVLLEAVKAVCRLLLLRVTRWRPLVTPPLPEREPLPDEAEGDKDGGAGGDDDEEQAPRSESELMDEVAPDSAAARDMDADGRGPEPRKPPHAREWTMPRTGLSLPSLPDPDDIGAYLVGRVLSADDIKPAGKLLNRLQGTAHAAEVLHILAPLIYATALALSHRATNSSKPSPWTPWLLGLTVAYAARQLRDRSLRTTTLERDEWNTRAWALASWAMRGACYDRVTRRFVAGLAKRMPAFVGGILEDYEYLWDNYYFSTSP